ncbi:MAG: hypothetical protein IJ537_07440 [Bacteroidaceae bacterium]|nr:hypothetical protein [Bacteroidaceae bacterium]MBQ8455154.1 hypothetical protein [Bacteroidaceae bacterium]MBQ9169796.1 hypothetical protein [Bacteroidaceae bacterium]MBQ9294334.1 hypothetical protein [Bacteroidaceae bacterium]
MKETYITPEVFLISLSAVRPLAVSQPDITTNPGGDAVEGKDLDVKESKSIWDEEW